MTNQYITAEEVRRLAECPVCGVGKNERCLRPGDEMNNRNHKERAKDARAALSWKTMGGTGLSGPGTRF